MFEKSATDLIRGLRHNKYSKEYIQKSLKEINQEIVNQDTRVNAIQKLIVLHLLGQDLQHYAFHIIESMSNKNEKKNGYLAASISFNQTTPVLIMATNLIKKDLRSNDSQETNMALHTLAQIVTQDLARDLHGDVLLLLNNSNPYIRKRALIVLYRMFLKYPDSLVDAFPRLRERLDDDDPSVVACCVTVICELGKLKPKAYLPLAPQLFLLFVGSTNNWTLIKMVKLFASLCPLEPRLVKKLLPQLKKMIETSRAISVVYECVYCIITGGMIGVTEDEEIIQLCVAKLQAFLEQRDQNLKYLGLHALGKLGNIRPDIVSEHRKIILQCLEDGDLSIRTTSLELILGLINQKSLFGIVKRLLVNLANSETTGFSAEEVAYRTLVGKSIIQACNKDMYSNVTNFEWYLQVLVDLIRFPAVHVGEIVKEQILDVCIRVPEVRSFAVQLMKPLLNDQLLFDTLKTSSPMTDVFVAAAWICGEFADSDFESTMNALLSPFVLLLPSTCQCAYLFAFLKMYIRSTIDFPPHTLLQPFLNSSYLEVQTRAMILDGLIAKSTEQLNSNGNPWTVANDLQWDLDDFKVILSQEFNPLSKNAQDKVIVPLDLDLDSWIEPYEHSLPLNNLKPNIYQVVEKPSLTINSKTLQEFYLDNSSPEKSAKLEVRLDIPIERLSMDEPLIVEEQGKPDRFSSIMNRPQVKKYALKLNADEIQDIPNSIPHDIKNETKTKKKKEKKHRKDRKDRKEKKAKGEEHSMPMFGCYTVWQNEEYVLEFKIGNQPPDFQTNLTDQIQVYFILMDNSSNYVPFEIESPDILSITNKKTYCSGNIQLNRNSPLEFYQIQIRLKLLFQDQTWDIKSDLPFSINVLLPNQLAVVTMSPQKFMDLLQTPPNGSFTAVGTTFLLPPPDIPVHICIEKIAIQLSCIIVERLPGAVSLYTLTCTGIPIVGLLKEKRNKAGKLCLTVDIKTESSLVLEWVLETLSSFSSDWIQ